MPCLILLNMFACFFVTSLVLLGKDGGYYLVSLGGVDVTSQHLDKCLEDSFEEILQNPYSSTAHLVPAFLALLPPS